ncbi:MULTISPECIES: hypothetical protein [Metallosphaera]|uniref:Uncharacterized protein n=3 Tax=Metallosphaera TaxID=41980 RepID=A4YFR2_METS5|nr:MULTISPECIES: hypothetical protein [Metallosphaera]ABP95264.1 hypothetical protein Msed_1100 [Metallosphaera sedula DSM 5348]AIM27250.1 hypothetical protein HA72_1100 [Metallosphaera sedula]AKV74140.1 hypothetical protein MsedA_1114 [Metallosphaera sedula]AKV76380.1 hypothetical protein MsedB_1116 [Metallosphaera sedula]AKV78631.1 hypothetical protein MsedC_1114 [Metallosphaera sedula]
MAIIVRKVHKRDDGTTVWIRVGDSSPIIKDGSVIDGGFFIRIGDDSGDKMIRLSDQEALDIAYRIIETYRRHVRTFAKLDELSYEQYKRTKRAENEEEEELTPELMEREIINFLRDIGGESTLEEIRSALGEEYAAYVRGPMKDKKVKIEGGKVKLLKGE